MARPRRDSGEKPAIERMEETFWAMLSEMPYQDITGKELRRRSGVSHNTFYYYFENIDDLAAKMFDRLMESEESKPTIVSLCNGVGTTNDCVESPIEPIFYSRMRSLAGSASPLLTGMLKCTVMDVWLDEAHVKEESLSQGDRVDLEFAFGGFVALLSSDLVDDVEVFRSFAKRDIGLGVSNTFTRIYRSVSLD